MFLPIPPPSRETGGCEACFPSERAHLQRAPLLPPRVVHDHDGCAGPGEGIARTCSFSSMMEPVNTSGVGSPDRVSASALPPTNPVTR